jgi:TPR repeat protein
MARIEMTNAGMVEDTANAASPEILFQLGLMYSSGLDREPDLVEAHKWFNLAALNGNRAAREYRQELAREMSADEIAVAQRQAREWLQTH